MEIIKTNSSIYRKQLIALYIEAFSSGKSEQHIDLSELNQYIDLVLRNGYTLVAIVENELCGAIWAHPLNLDPLVPTEISRNVETEKCLYVAEMMVSEKVRGQGIGKQLLTTFLETADTCSFPDVFIRVWDENIPALNLYRTIGFKDIAYIKQTKTTADESGTFVMQKIYLHKKLV